MCKLRVKALFNLQFTECDLVSFTSVGKKFCSGNCPLPSVAQVWGRQSHFTTWVPPSLLLWFQQQRKSSWIVKSAFQEFSVFPCNRLFFAALSSHKTHIKVPTSISTLPNFGFRKQLFFSKSNYQNTTILTFLTFFFTFFIDLSVFYELFCSITHTHVFVGKIFRVERL